MGEETRKKQRVVIVGGGPSGAACAKALADAGEDVRLFEAYQHPESIEKNSPAAYVIALGIRGQRGIKIATGIEPLEAFPNAVISRHLVRHIHPKKNKTMKRDPPGLIMPRKFMASHLLNVAEKAGVDVFYQHRLVDFDLTKKIATFQDAQNGGAVKEVPYDLLIGADGSNSAVRTLLHDKKKMSGNEKDFSVVRIEQDSMEYQVCVLPPSEAASVYEGLPETSSHAWNNKTYNSICIAFPLPQNGGHLFPVVFPEGKLKEFKEQHAKDGTGYDEPLQSLFPDLSDTVKKHLADQLMVGEPANGGKCIWCSSLGSPKDGVVLVGDSGHGMWPSLGQGANCALESAGVFAETIRDIASSGKVAGEEGTSSASSWPELVVNEFQRRRHKDVLAAVDLTYGGIGGRQSRGRLNAPLSYKLQIAGMMLLNKLSMGVFPKPALLRLLYGDPIPYSKAHKWNFFYEKWICRGLATVTVAFVAAKFLIK